MRPPVSWTPRLALLAFTALVGTGCLPLPNLVVPLLLAPDAAWPGDSLSTTTQVCNQGAYAAAAGQLHLALREAGVPESEQPLETVWLPVLYPGECATVATDAPTPPGLPDGAYEVVARSDAGIAMVAASTNHERVSDAFGIGYGPDLHVAGVSGPPSARIGDPIVVTAAICNRGTAPSTPSDVDIYLSEDDSIDGVLGVPPLPEPDPFAGSMPVPSLPAATCASVEGLVQANAPTEGEYRLGAFVDASFSVGELVESNNAAVDHFIGVGDAPDLVVQSLAAPASATPGSPFDVPFEVCNQGQTSSSPSSLSLYLSEDDEIEPGFPDPASGDWFLDEIPVPPLAPGECHAKTAEIVASSPEDGAYHLGGLVDEHDDVIELREGNNARATDPMGVGWNPDLVPGAITAPYSVDNGSSFDAQVELCNQGTLSSPPSLVRLFLSTDTALDPLPEGSDTDVGDAFFPPLAPGECAQETLSGFASTSQSGAHHLLAQADTFDDVEELIESNNVAPGPLLGVGFGPDLVVTAITAPASVSEPQPFDATATVCNRGTAFSTPTEMHFFHSVDETIQAGVPGPPPDPIAGSLPLAPLEPGRCVPVGGTLYPSVTGDGAYFLGAIVDAYEWVDELIETNNAFTGDLMGVGDGPDLVVTDVGGPPGLPSDDLSELSFNVCNQGTDPSVPTHVHLYVSDDTVIETGPPGPGPVDHYLGDEPIPGLAPGACHGASQLFWIPGTLDGVRHLGAVVDEWEMVDELIETNNARASEPVGIGHDPDLVVGSITAPTSAHANDPIAVDAEVCNQGTVSAGPASVHVYLSEDDQITGALFGPSPDMHVGVLDAPPLAAGACATASGTVFASVPDDGAWHLGAIVDEDESVGELIETNNTTVGPVLAIGAGPDLVVTSLVGPPSATGGVSFDVDVTACNHGTEPSPVSTVMLYHTVDATIEGVYSAAPFPDAFLIDVPLAPLLSGECHTELKTVVAFPPAEGPGYLAATIDEMDSVPEIVESNNERLGPELEITPGGP